MARLIFKTGVYAGKGLTLVKGKVYVLGRNRDVEVPLPDPKLSRRHCQFIDNGERILLKDLNSTNGTFINGTRLSGEVELQPLDHVAFGDVEVEVEVMPPKVNPVGVKTQVAPPSRGTPVPVPAAKWASSPPATKKLQSQDAAKPVPLVEIPSGSGELIIPDEPAPAKGDAPEDPFEAALREVSLPLPPDPPPLPPPPPSKARLLFCDRCNSSIPQLDADLGFARDVQGKLLCKQCVTASPKPAEVPAHKLASSSAITSQQSAAPKKQAALPLELDDQLEELT